MLEGCQIIGYDWRYLYVNNAVARHGRTTKEKLLGRTMMEAYPGIEKTKMFAKLQRCMKERIPVHMENEFEYPDEKKRWFELSVQPVHEGIFILSIDITEHKMAQKALEDSERKYRALAENAMDGIYVISVEGFEYVNPTFEEIVGYKARELCRKEFNFLSIIHPEDRHLIEERRKARERGGKLSRRYSFRILTKDGGLKFVEVNTIALPGERVKVLGIVRDVTEHKKAERELRESEELFRSIVENSHAGIIIVDDAYKLIYVNDELYRMLEYSREEIIGQDFRKFLDEESKRFVADRYIRRQ